MDPLRESGKLLVLVGVLLAVTGVFLWSGARLPLRLGHLPGDIVHRGERTTFYFPIVACIVLSAVLTLVLWIIGRFRQ
jgi:hypothetical protein